MRSLPHLPSVAAIAVALVGSLALAAGGTSAAVAAQHPSRIAVNNAQPQLTHATAVGTPSGAQLVDVKLYLADQHTAELNALIKAVSTPGTARYGHYLTGAQFRARYAPSSSAVSAVRKFVTGAGLSVTAVPDNRAYVAARGTVSQLQKAFGTSLKKYTLNGQTVRAAAGTPTVPAALSGKIIALTGLASQSTMMRPDHEDGAKVKGSTAPLKTAAAKPTKVTTSAPPSDAFVNAPPCSSYFAQKIASDVAPAYGSSQPYVTCGYVPAQLQGAYGLTSSIKKGLDGHGVTVAITDAYASPTVLSDANTYAVAHGEDAFGANQFKQTQPTAPYRLGYDDAVNGDQCGEQGWYGEETLDVEAVHAVAPGAKVTYVPSASCDNGDLADTLNMVVDKHLASIVTNSWGGTNETNGPPASLDQVYQQIFFQAALEGIGFYFSSGDGGDGSASNGGVTTVDAPANDPLVTAVGGTALAVSKHDEREFETGWSTSKSVLTAGAWTPPAPGTYLYGAGGGTSQVFGEPWYQRGVVPASLTTYYSSTPGRVVPDVSAVGDPNTGFLVGQTQTFPDGTVKYSEYRIGGTSLSSPLFAGMMAIADQTAGYPHGFANPALYSLYGSKALYDPKPVTGVGVVRVDYLNSVDATGGTTTSLRTLDAELPGTILRTTPGYDDITGVGSPNGKDFFKKLDWSRSLRW